MKPLDCNIIVGGVQPDVGIFLRGTVLAVHEPIENPTHKQQQLARISIGDTVRFGCRAGLAFEHEGERRVLIERQFVEVPQ